MFLGRRVNRVSSMVRNEYADVKLEFVCSGLAFTVMRMRFT